MPSVLKTLIEKYLFGLCGCLLSFVAVAQSCELDVLQQLGWRVVPTDSVKQSSPFNTAAVCQSVDLQDAYQQQLLQLPDNFSPSQLQDALHSQASRCAFQFKVGKAVQQATQRLMANPHYRFTALQMGWVHFSDAVSAKQWQQTKNFGRRFQPKLSNSDAAQVFYSGRLRAECGTGRQIAQIATLRELFGDAGFNQAFTAAELSIGTFMSLHDSDSVLLGRNKGQLFADGSGVKTAALGQQAWLGTPGFIVHVKEAKYLDDMSNQAENFVVVDVSAKAQQQLAASGGFAKFNRDNEQFWQYSQQISMVGKRYFERLLIENDVALWQGLPAKQRAIAEKMRAILEQPFYQEFVVHVHPMGNKPIAYHLARLLDRNPRTPYKIELALHNLPTEIYQRWLNTQLAQCRQRPTHTHTKRLEG